MDFKYGYVGSWVNICICQISGGGGVSFCTDFILAKCYLYYTQNLDYNCVNICNSEEHCLLFHRVHCWWTSATSAGGFKFSCFDVFSSYFQNIYLQNFQSTTNRPIVSDVSFNVNQRTVWLHFCLFSVHPLKCSSQKNVPEQMAPTKVNLPRPHMVLLVDFSVKCFRIPSSFNFNLPQKGTNQPISLKSKLVKIQ